MAVLDPVPSYRRGLLNALAEAGFSSLAVDDPDGLDDGEAAGPCAVLATLRNAGDWQQVADLRARSRLARDLKIVALLPEPTPRSYAEALDLGADGAVAWEASPVEVADVITAAVRGQVVLPAEVARALAPHGQRSLAPQWLTRQEIEWLRQLGRGTKVNELAECAGYSERAMYRLLQGLYGRIGVPNRMLAVVQAERWGLLGVSTRTG